MTVGVGHDLGKSQPSVAYREAIELRKYVFVCSSVFCRYSVIGRIVFSVDVWGNAVIAMRVIELSKLLGIVTGVGSEWDE